MIEKKLAESVDYIRSKTNLKPQIGLVLGSGLGSLVDDIKVENKIPYDEIPCFSQPTVVGHSGALIFGHIDDIPVAILQGRVHFYEGHSMEKVVHPVRTLAMLGIEKLLLTNSAGGLGEGMKPGDFMIIEDHINLMGANPLMGPNPKNMGPRFPDMTEAYDKKLRELLAQALEKNQVDHHRGVYCGVSGPTYETPAEVRFLGKIGGTAVGMSTVPETIAAHHMGVRVCGVSCITNLASGISSEKLSHDDVTTIAKKVENKLCLFIKDFVRLANA